MELRPYQQEARTAVEQDWANGFTKTLLVLPTGCGKTIVFCKIVEDMVRQGGRCLLLAHRGELLEQAADGTLPNDRAALLKALAQYAGTGS